MPEITIIVPGPPVAKGRPVAGRSFGAKQFTTMRTPQNTVIYENHVRQCAFEAMKGMIPLDGAISVHMVAIFPLVKSLSKKDRQLAIDGVLLPTKKPDVDNTAKSILDGCNGVVFGDDSQVTELHINKIYGEIPQVIIKVKKV